MVEILSEPLAVCRNSHILLIGAAGNFFALYGLTHLVTALSSVYTSFYNLELVRPMILQLNQTGPRLQG